MHDVVTLLILYLFSNDTQKHARIVRKEFDCKGNSMICSDIWHKYHERYFKIVLRNFMSHQVIKI